MKSERGNVLFLILIAVALFAALSYAVSSSTRGGGSDVSADKAELGAAQIVQSASALTTAIMRMKFSNSCADNQINFQSAVIYPDPFDGENTDAPPNHSCDLFHPSGGGAIAQKFDTALFDAAKMTAGNGYIDCCSADTLPYYPAFSGSVAVTGAGLTDGTAQSADLIMTVYGLSDTVCKAINKRLGVNPPSYILNSGFYVYPFFNSAADFAPNATPFNYSSVCVHDSYYDANFFLHVLVAR